MADNQDKPLETILVVDDDTRLLSLFSRHLRKAGYQVLTAADGMEAMEIYARENPTIAIVDVRLPHIDGFQVLQAIREQDPETEVIMITGHADMNMAISALRIGASDFIPKPLEPAVLTATLQRAEERLRLKQELRAARAELEQYAADLEARNHELRQAQARLVREENLAFLAQLAIALAHEVNNPLATIKTLVSITKRLPEATPSVRERMTMIDQEVDRISAVVSEISNVPRFGQEGMRAVSVNELVHTALYAAQQQGLLKDIKVETHLAPDLPPTQGHADQLVQMVLNVIINSLEAMAQTDSKQENVLTVTTEVDKPSAHTPATIKIHIADTGPGIPQHALNRAFAPDYSTKIKNGEVQGLGLGLLVTRGIVESHDGKIQLQNQPQEQGLLVTISLPAAEGEVTQSNDTPDK